MAERENGVAATTQFVILSGGSAAPATNRSRRTPIQKADWSSTIGVPRLVIRPPSADDRVARDDNPIYSHSRNAAPSMRHLRCSGRRLGRISLRLRLHRGVDSRNQY